MKLVARIVIILLILAGIAYLYLSPEPDRPSGELDPFDAWREVRDALQDSPDHLPARARRLVEAGDPRAVYEFVRDDILVRPSDEGGYSGRSPVNRSYWGGRAALRGGVAAPRDQAELLAALYREMGLDARVMQGAPSGDFDLDPLFDQTPDREFAPAASASDLQRWADALGHRAPDPVQTVDADRRRTRDIADQIIALAGAGEAPADLTPPTAIPTVEVMIDGEATYATPMMKTGRFGESYVQGRPTPASSPYSPPDIQIRLEAARSDAPFERRVLVEGRWPVDQLAGRRVEARFTPPMDVDAALRARASDIDTFIPVLTVSGDGLAAEDAEALSRVGDPVTLGGEILSVPDDGPVSIDGAMMSEAEADAAARVAQLDVQADAGAWPRISLDVRALDADGAPVDGLGAASFSLADEGDPEGFQLVRNTSAPPRILFLIDRSTSLPEAYRGDAMVELAGAVAEDAAGIDPETVFRAASINFGLTWEGVWVDSPDALRAQVAQPTTGDSDFWRALAEIAEEDAAMIVLVTDARQDPERAPSLEEMNRIGGGPPVLAIGVGDADSAMLASIASMTGGEARLAAGPADVAAATSAFLDGRRDISYRLRYRAAGADAEAGDGRTAALSLGDRTAEARYVVPERPARPAALSGLYLTIRMGGEETTRTLAGYGEGFTTNPRVPESALEETGAALFGRTVISVEGPAATPSVRLTDWYEAKLALELLWEAIESGDRDAMISQAGQASLPPGELIRLAIGGGDVGGTQVYAANPQITLLSERPVWGQGWVRTADLLSISRVEGLSPDGEANWRATMEAGVYAAIAEDAVLGGGTVSLLNGEALALIDARSPDFAGLDDTARQAWRVAMEPYRSRDFAIIGPADGAPLSFYALHRPSGDLAAILPDGSGGARGAGGRSSAHDGHHRYRRPTGRRAGHSDGRRLGQSGKDQGQARDRRHHHAGDWRPAGEFRPDRPRSRMRSRAGLDRLHPAARRR
jgi:hypothetical protein